MDWGLIAETLIIGVIVGIFVAFLIFLYYYIKESFINKGIKKSIKMIEEKGLPHEDAVKEYIRTLTNATKTIQPPVDMKTYLELNNIKEEINNGRQEDNQSTGSYQQPSEASQRVPREGSPKTSSIDSFKPANIQSMDNARDGNSDLNSGSIESGTGQTQRGIESSRGNAPRKRFQRIE